MFEALIREVAGRFGIGDKSKALLAALLALIFDQRSGGSAGLLARFREVGLENLFTSWLGATEPPPIEPQQLEDVLGSQVVSGMANQLGLSRSTTLGAAATMLPRLIALLSRGGEMPTRLPPAASAYAVTPIGPAAVADVAAPPNLAPGLGWVKWVLLAAVVLTLGYCVLYRNIFASRQTPVAETASDDAGAVPTASPVLSLAMVDGTLRYSGRVGSNVERDQFIRALPAEPTSVSVGNIDVDPGVKPALWLASLGTLLPEFIRSPGAKLEFSGDTVTLGGSLSEQERSHFAVLLRRLFGSLTLKGLDAGVLQNASAAFKALLPGKYAADDLVKALNLMTIHFDTGSAAISADSLDILSEAALAIKNAPATTRIGIDGYTDNTGDAAANLALSDQRANAVRARLVELGVAADALTAKGHGDAQPVADNATDDGRARNRRMEFSVLR